MIGELAALGAAVSWTVSAMLYRKALADTKPISANIIRLTCTSAVLLLFLAAIGKIAILANLPAHVVVLASVSGIIGLGIGDTLYMISLRSVGVARSVPITCTYPLFNLLWAIFFQKEYVTSSIVLGAVIIVLGIWLLSHERDGNNSEARQKMLQKGILFSLATAIVWSISIALINVAVKQTPDLDHAMAINTIRAVAIAISLLAISPIVHRNLVFHKVQMRTVITLIVGGIVALGFGWFLLTYSFIQILESRAVPISSTTPLFSTMAGIFLLRENVTPKNVLGSIMIVIGIFLLFIA
jgi:DME family drug/metabolite transporter